MRTNRDQNPECRPSSSKWSAIKPLIDCLTVSSLANAATSPVTVFSAMATQISSTALRRCSGASAMAAGIARLNSISSGNPMGVMPVMATVCCMKSIATSAW
ncbi:hypothetical protein D3C87_1691280 [compost metagenome]